MKLATFPIWAACALMILPCSGCGSDDNPPAAPQPNLSISALSVEEGNANKRIFVDILLDAPSSETITVEVSTQDGTAKAGEDYTAVSGQQLVFTPGDLRESVAIDLIGDADLEADETFLLRLSNPQNAKLGTAEGTITILNDDNAGGVVIPSGGYSTPTSYPGMSLVWSDEFSGETLADHWRAELGGNGWGNNELQFYRAENTSIVEGHLVIEARQEGFGGRAYTSSRLITQGKYSVQYGRIDIRAALPYGQGIWPALWMLGDNFSTVGWPACGEIDIMEMVGGPGDNTVHGTAHWQDTPNKADYGGSYTLPSGKFHGTFHVFSIVWDANSIKWYVDDIKYHEMAITDPDLSEFRAPFFFIFNVAVGGNWPGSPNASTVFPQRMIVDYVRVFQPE
jgi:hypothetical protein